MPSPDPRTPNRLPRHEDVGAAVLAVIPPRAVPWKKRVLWRLVLWILRTAAGRRVLAALITRGNR